MIPLTLPRHHPAPPVHARTADGSPLTLREFRFRHDLLLVMLHGPGCPHCVQLAEEMAAHRNDWEDWGTTALLLQSESGAPMAGPFRVGVDPDGAARRQYAGGKEADAVLAILDHRGRFMEGWALTHPEPVDWHEVAETVRWVAIQEPECGACEVLPGWE